MHFKTSQVFTSFIMIVIFLVQSALAQTIDLQKNTITSNLQSIDQHMEVFMSDVSSIIDNETFLFRGVYGVEGWNRMDRIDNDCVFESPSAVWIIETCSPGRFVGDQGFFRSQLRGRIAIKRTNISMAYSLESPSSSEEMPDAFFFDIYKNLENSSLQMNGQPVHSVPKWAVDCDSSYNSDMYIYYSRYISQHQPRIFRLSIDWSNKLPFLKTLARKQDQFIQQYLHTPSSKRPTLPINWSFYSVDWPNNDLSLVDTDDLMTEFVIDRYVNTPSYESVEPPISWTMDSQKYKKDGGYANLSINVDVKILLNCVLSVKTIIYLQQTAEKEGVIHKAV